MIEPKSRLRLVNAVLSIIAAGLAIYIIAAPLLPQATWIITEETPLSRVFSGSDTVAEAANKPPESTGNKLFIPKLKLDEIIHEGGVSNLSKGVLRRDFTSTPDKGGNTVLAGHRFGYTGTGVFYHLDKLKVGDSVIVHWEGQKYSYVVRETKVVKANNTTVEQATKTDQLTMYTCTPLWNAVDRLVVIAELDGVTQ